MTWKAVPFEAAVEMRWCMTWKAVLFETVVKQQSSKMRCFTPWKAVPFETVVKNATVRDLEGCSVGSGRQKCDGA